jgi:hypothetical protein
MAIKNVFKTLSQEQLKALTKFKNSRGLSIWRRKEDKIYTSITWSDLKEITEKLGFSINDDYEMFTTQMRKQFRNYILDNNLQKESYDK